MAVLAKFGLFALGLGAPLAAGAYYLLEYMGKPGTFRGKLLHDGKVLISGNEGDKWRAKFSDFGAEMKGKVPGITNVEDTSNIEQQVNKLKEWCGKESEKGSSESGYEDYSNFCSTELRSLKGKMISEGIEMASSDDDWKNLFLQHKHDTSFLDKVNGIQVTSVPRLTSSSKASEAHDKLNQYCATLLNVSPSDENRGFAQKWCIKSTLKTVGDRLSSLSGFSRPSGGDYEKIVEKWKNNQEFKTVALKDQTAGTDDKDKLKNYCDGELAKNLISLDNSYDTDMKNIYNFCNGTLPDGDANELREISWQS